MCRQLRKRSTGLVRTQRVRPDRTAVFSRCDPKRLLQPFRLVFTPDPAEFADQLHVLVEFPHIRYRRIPASRILQMVRNHEFLPASTGLFPPSQRLVSIELQAYVLRSSALRRWE